MMINSNINESLKLLVKIQNCMFILKRRISYIWGVSLLYSILFDTILIICCSQLFISLIGTLDMEKADRFRFKTELDETSEVVPPENFYQSLPQGSNVVTVKETFLSVAPFALKNSTFFRELITSIHFEEVLGDSFHLIHRLCVGGEADPIQFIPLEEARETPEFKRLGVTFVKILSGMRGSPHSNVFNQYFHEAVAFILLGCFLNNFSKQQMKIKLNSIIFRTFLLDMVTEWITGLRLTHPQVKER